MITIVQPLSYNGMYNRWGSVHVKISTNSKRIPQVVDRRLTDMINLVIKGQMLVKNNSKARYFVRDGDLFFFFSKLQVVKCRPLAKPRMNQQNICLLWVQHQIILFHPATYHGHTANDAINKWIHIICFEGQGKVTSSMPCSWGLRRPKQLPMVAWYLPGWYGCAHD